MEDSRFFLGDQTLENERIENTSENNVELVQTRYSSSSLDFTNFKITRIRALLNKAENKELFSYYSSS